MTIDDSVDAAMSAPGYWMNETSGVVRPAVQAYLQGGPLSDAHVVTLRAYFRQWIMNGAWVGPGAETLRRRLNLLTSRAEISAWIDLAIKNGIDPL